MTMIKLQVQVHSEELDDEDDVLEEITAIAKHVSEHPAAWNCTVLEYPELDYRDGEAWEI